MAEDPCYDASELAAAVAGRLPMSQTEKILQHAERCQRCDQILIELEAQPPSDGDLVDAVKELPETKVHDAPAQIDEYIIHRKLGEGGLGVVFLAQHKMLSNNCVIKVIQKHHGSRQDIQERFLREMKVLSGLEHENIVRVFSAGWWRDQPYLVMEFLEGEDLEDRVRRDGPLPVDAACQVIAEAASALHYAHEKNITHRDIKPSNLFATRQGVTKVIDFGLARIVEAAGENAPAKLTREGTIAGTPEYMSPEQFRSTKVTGASDAYSLGVTLIYLLTGKLPATGDMMEMMRYHSQPRPVKLPPEMNALPAEVTALIRQMLQYEATVRPTMEEIAVALQTFLNKEHAHSNAAATDAPAAQPNRRRLLMFSSLAMVASIALIALSAWPLQLLSGDPAADGSAPVDGVVDDGGAPEQDHPSITLATRAVSSFELTAPLRKAVNDSIRERSEATEMVDDGAGALYSLRVFPLPSGANGKRLWPAILSREKTKATARLLKVDSIRKAAQKEGLTDTSGLDEAIEYAAADPKFVGTVKNLSSHQKALDGSAITLVYAPQEQVNSTLQSEIAIARLREAYRDAIHRQSRRLMEQKRWGESLELWRHLHKLELTSPELYLDTAKCFIALKQPADATGLLKQTLKTHATHTDWRFFEEVGELLLSIESKDAQDAAVEAFDLAGEKYTVTEK